MSEKNIFEVAVMSKFRFPFRGQVSVEDLYDLSVENLDEIFKVLNNQIKQSSEESLLNKRSLEDQELVMKIEIVKNVVAMKLEQKAEKAKALENRRKKQRLLEILNNKKDQELLGKTPEELEQMISELE